MAEDKLQVEDRDSNVDSNDETHPILLKLQAALHADGDFPVRARVVTELRTLANNPNTSVDRITEVILREPSLGTRVLHLVNSAYFRRAAPIMTVTQAVIHIGMGHLVDLCAGLVLMQKFIPAARRGGIFADNLKKSILTSLIASFLVCDEPEPGIAERGYLAGTFYSLGYLLLAYYFPQVYEVAAKRAEARDSTIEQSVAEVVGVGRRELSLAIIDALTIPEYYRLLLVASQPLPSDVPVENTEDEEYPISKALIKGLSVADQMAEMIAHSKPRAELEALVDSLVVSHRYRKEDLDKMLKDLPNIFHSHCQFIELSFLSVPKYLTTWGEAVVEEDEIVAEQEKTPAGFSYYLNEIRQAIDNNEPLSSIITTVMETFAFGLDYDRVVLLLADETRTRLRGRMGLGKLEGINPAGVDRPLSTEGESSPDAQAFRLGTPQIFGEPVFENGWPFAAISIGQADRAVGVIYVDNVAIEGVEPEPLDQKSEAALSVISDLLDQAVRANTK